MEKKNDYYQLTKNYKLNVKLQSANLTTAPFFGIGAGYVVDSNYINKGEQWYTIQ